MFSVADRCKLSNLQRFILPSLHRSHVLLMDSYYG
jgi:hypothetical protein